MEAISDILKIVQGFSSGHEARRQKIGLQQTGVNNMLNAAQTEEQLNSVMSALDNIKEYSSEYDSTNFNQNAIRFAAENKKAAYDDFSNAIQQADEFFKSDKYKSKSSDWVDLDATRESLNEQGLNYESNLEMVSNEYLKIGTLRNKITAGAAQFRIPKIGDGTFDEDQLSVNIGNYQGFLDKALTAMVGDKVITIDEAENITKANFTSADMKSLRNEKKSMFTTEIKQSDSILSGLQSEQLSLLTGDDLIGQLMNLGLDEETLKLASGDFIAGNKTAEETIKVLIDAERIRNKELRDKYNQAVGYYYADESIYPDDANVDEEGGAVVINEIDQITDEALADVDAGEKEVTDKQLTEKYGTTDPVEIQKIIKGETPSRLTTDNIIIDNIETDGVDQTMNKVVDGTLTDDSFINLLDNADISSYGDFDYTELADMIKNNEMPDSIAEAYRSAALDVPTFLEFLQNPPTVENLEKAFFEKYPEKLDEFTDEQKRNTKINFSYFYLSPKNKQYITQYKNLKKNLEDWTSLDKQKSGNSLKKFLSDELNMLQAVKEGTDEKLGKKMLKRSSLTYNESNMLKEFKKKYKDSNLTLEEFINQNQAEFRNIALTIKYGLQILPRRSDQN